MSTSLSDGMPGPHNAITDVPGIRVGHYERIGAGWASGTTVVLATSGAVAGVECRGGAPGTRETDLLRPTNLVERVHAVCLSGGSAYGLAAADGVMRWLAERGHGLPVEQRAHEVVPIVPAAVLFDLPRNAWGNRPDTEFGYAACEAATVGRIAQGCVGAGTGATLGSVKGGVGTASLRVSDGVTVGALAAANPLGEAVDHATGRAWAAELERDGEFAVHWPRRAVSVPGPRGRFNTTIGVVAVNAELTKAQCQRLAAAAQDGVVSAVRPAHSLFDGDTVFALATGGRALTPATGADTLFATAAELDQLATAAVDVFARAIVHALLTAWSLTGVPCYRELWPEATD